MLDPVRSRDAKTTEEDPRGKAGLVVKYSVNPIEPERCNPLVNPKNRLPAK
jgi:hypothetical protein